MTQRQSKQLTWITIGFIILLIGIVIGADTGFEGFRATGLGGLWTGLV